MFAVKFIVYDPASAARVGLMLSTLVTVLYVINVGNVVNPWTERVWASGQSPPFASANTVPSRVPPTPSCETLVTAALPESHTIEGDAWQSVMVVNTAT